MIVVLIYSFGILVYNRRVIKKQAAAEANEKSEQEAELHPMLTNTSYIPFGARALERGIETEGIWVSNSNSPLPSPPHHPSTPIKSFPLSPTLDWPLKEDAAIATSEVKMPAVAHPMTFHMKSPEAQRNPRVGIDNGARDKRREGFPHDQFRATRYPHLVAAGRNEPHAADEPKLHPSKKNRRSSWIRSPEILKRAPVIESMLLKRSPIILLCDQLRELEADLSFLLQDTTVGLHLKNSGAG